MSRNKIRLIFFSILILIFLIGNVPPAQGVVSLRVTPKKVNMGLVGISDYEAGYKEVAWGNLLLLRDTTNDWKVMVRTDDNNMGVIGNYTKPISDFNWKARGDYATQITYRDISTYDVEAARGPKDVRAIVYIDYKILLSWAKDVPGDYNLTVMFTLTTQ